MGALVVAAAVLIAPASRASDSKHPAPAPNPFPVYRLGYVAGGVLALTGAGFGIAARVEAMNAGTLASAREATATLDLARDHAATANLCFAMAGASVVYALALEFLPRPAADVASLTFRF
jgi:hypothetical protein